MLRLGGVSSAAQGDCNTVTKLEAEIDRVRTNILTEENLTELVTMTNEEISQASSCYEEQLAVMDGQLENLRGGLQRLYHALETGKLDVGDLAPRLTALKSQIKELQNKRFDADGYKHVLGLSAWRRVTVQSALESLAILVHI